MSGRRTTVGILSGAIDVDRLLTLLRACAHLPTVNLSESVADTSAELMTILVVDDDPDTRTLLRLILETEGYSVVEAGHGEEALGMIGPHVPDVVVTDLAMPVLNGVALIERLRSEPRTATIPIVVVSASDEADALQSTGRVKAVVRKPFDATAFAECIRAIATISMRSAPAM